MLVSLCLAFAAAQQPLAPPGLAPNRVSAGFGAEFGRSVAIDGDLAVVGAPFAGDGTAEGGRAYVYAWDGASWQYEAPLDAPGTYPQYDGFGHGVDVSGGRVLVGCRYTTTIAGFNAGAAMVFERVGGVWTQTAELTPPVGYAGLHYGLGVSIEGDVAVLSGRNTEAPYLVYERQTDGTWRMIQEIFLQNPAGARALVNSEPVVENGRLFLPDPYLVTPTGYSGEIQVWEQGSGGWTFAEAIRSQLPDGPYRFGNAFDVSGDTLVVGSSEIPIAPGKAGLVYVFQRIAGAWTPTELFSDAEGPFYLEYGAEVALSDDYLAVAQIGSSEFFGPNGTPSKVYLYRRGEDGHVFERTEDDPFGVPPYDPFGTNYGTLFGRALALDGERLIAGAEWDEVLFEDAGQAYAFDVGRLGIDTPAISLASGGTQQFDVQPGVEFANRIYALVGSVSGTAPGVVLDGVLLPLNLDGYSLKSLDPTGSPIAIPLGFLDADGRANTSLTLPPATNPALAGIQAHHAALVIDANLPAVVAASEAEKLELLP